MGGAPLLAVDPSGRLAVPAEAAGLRRIGVLVALVVLLFPDVSQATPLSWMLIADASMVSLQADATDRDLYASFAMRGAFSDEVREKIATGLPVTFTYY